MATTRRELLGWASATLAGGLLPRFARATASLPQTTLEALAGSDLVYITPLRSNGEESKCHAEIWFTFDGQDLFVVTASDAWRARAIERGLTRARIWIGDFGNWKRAEERYRSAPELEAVGETVSDARERARVLDLYGDKYTLQWIVWGPRFRNALKDGTRTMIRYRPRL
jgi:hypothetical protein